MSDPLRTTTHTPGPWWVGGSLIAHKQIEVARVLHYADARRHTNDQSISAPLLAEADANARLIAKAPELLDLLAQAIAVLGADGVRYGITREDIEPLDVLREARALLAEIDGGSAHV